MTHTREDAQALIATDQAQLLLSGLWDDYCEAGTANGSTDNGAIELYDIDGMFEAAHAIFDAATAAEARLAAVEAENVRMREALGRIRNEAMRVRGDQAYRDFPKFALNVTRAAIAPKPTEGDTP